jgi:hypothetical protein
VPPDAVAEADGRLSPRPAEGAEGKAGEKEDREERERFGKFNLKVQIFPVSKNVLECKIVNGRASDLLLKCIYANVVATHCATR